MTQIWVLYRQSGSDRLEKQPTDLRQYTCYFGDRTLEAKAGAFAYAASASGYNLISEKSCNFLLPDGVLSVELSKLL
jgi:hypothetical protein